jgi:hypothetical protein
MRSSRVRANLVYRDDDFDAYAVNQQDSQDNNFPNHGCTFLWSEYLSFPYKKTSLLTGRQEGRSFQMRI